MKHIITVIAVMIALLQGGFTDAVWSMCGIAAAVFLCFRLKKCLPMPVMITMAAIIPVYAVSALLHGLPFESLAALGRLMVICLMLLSFHNMDTDACETVFIAGMVVAVIGFVTFCDVFSWDGAVASRRLQSVFQYSNVTGLFLGVSAFLTRRSEKKSSYSFFLETALVLTQSVGALLVYAAAWGMLIGKNRESRIAPVFLSFTVSLLSAAIIYAVVYYSGIPQIAILLPAALIIFRKKLQSVIVKVSAKKCALFASCGFSLIAVSALLAVRGLIPLGTYIERLIHISDGARILISYPLGIGPGAWQFFYQTHQSAPYDATILHSGYAEVGVEAGFLAVIPMVLFMLYWLKNQKWDDKSICIIMIILHAAMDISFSFLVIALITAMLISDTLPKDRSKLVPVPFRGLLAIPIALLTIVFASSAVINSAQWEANAGDIEAASARLESRLLYNGTEAALMQMRLSGQMGEFSRLDDVFGGMPVHNAEAYAIKAQSLIARGEYREAAGYALMSAEMSPHSPAGFALLEEAVLPLDTAARVYYHDRVSLLKEERKENALFAFIRGMGGGVES